MKSLYSILSIGLCVVVSACVLAKNSQKVKPTNHVETALKQYVDSGELAGAISVLYNNGAEDIMCAGWANVEQKRPISMEQSFMQCSQTKGFCGVTIAILLEEGKISLDDPVSKYLPEFKEMKVLVKDKDGKTALVPAKNQITIRMVMNHTGGFPFEIPTKSKKGWPALSLRDTAKEAASRPILFEPGTRTQYSNTGIDIGAAVIEVVTGKPWDVFLKERVLDPLGMKDTTFQPTEAHLKNSISIYDYKNPAKPEFSLFRTAMPLPHNGPNVHPSAGAGLWTTANDQIRFYKMLMNAGVGDNGVRILKEETVRNVLATSSRPKGMEAYSLGLLVSKNGWFGHGGAWGTNCMVNIDKKQLNLWIVQAVNSKKSTWRAARGKVIHQYFNAKTNNDIDKYTGRTK